MGNKQELDLFSLLVQEQSKVDSSLPNNTIRLDNEYYVSHDNLSWTLLYRKEGKINEKTGKPTISSETFYYPSLTLVLQKYKDQAIKPCKDVIEVLDKLNVISNNINKLFNK